ncbi:hypothetical protein EVA_18169, partial [gut metagenome]
PEMTMPTDEGIVRTDRHLLLVVEMAVGQKEPMSFINEQQIVGHHWKLEEHLVDLRITVASQGYNLVGSGIEIGNDTLGVDSLGDAVAWTIVEDVSKDTKHIAMILIVELEHFLQGWTTAVDV